MNAPLSVTLVGGFPGAGKTSLLHHFVSEHATGPVAIFTEGVGMLNLDARAMKGLCGAMNRTHDAVFEMPSTHETAQVDWLAARLEDLARNGEVSRILIEVAGTANAARLGRRFGSGGKADSLPHCAKLDRIVCVIDALDFFHSVVIPSRGRRAAAFLDFQQSQIEGASLLVLNKCDLVAEAERDACIETINSMNPDAALIETAYGELPLQLWSQADSEQQIALALEPRQRAESKMPEGNQASPDPELASTTYRAFRPFHPARFWDWFEAQQPGLLRVKGLVWLASRNLLVGGISRTRGQSSCGGAGIWWAALPREEWPTDHATLERMQESWREPWGDRRQELVLLGEAKTLPRIVNQLASCLLNDEEFARPPGEWRSLPDPFPAWDVGSES